MFSSDKRSWKQGLALAHGHEQPRRAGGKNWRQGMYASFFLTQ